MHKLNTKGVSHLLIPVLVFVVLGAVGGTFLLFHSKAATTDTTTTTATEPSADALVRGSGMLCLSVNHAQCITSHGPGNSATIQSTNRSSWTVHTTGSYNTYMFSNGANNCLQALDNGVVTVSSNACTTSVERDKWHATDTSPLRFYNVHLNHSKFMGTAYTSPGSRVTDQFVYNGFFWGWVFN